ncbi:transmembrane channel-like protein 7 [Rhopilema esculentum]|uniref:transmembrane channel-like protein 7 n=1 Tax=Rhopilema esculentum TaxID=499914 RepID=UPI0031D7CADE
MATNDNTERFEDLVELDPDDIAVSAFENQDEFKPKIFNKQKAFGKRRSFLCYRNVAFDASFDAFEEETESTTEFTEIGEDFTDFAETSTDLPDIETDLPSRLNRRKQGSLKQRRAERIHQNKTNEGAILPAMNRSQTKISGWKQFKYGISFRFGAAKDGIKGFFKDIDIWKSNLKPVEGKFGSGVLSYFLFLRWLFLLDLVITVMILAFVLAPQLMYKPSFETNKNNFNGLELLTGEGWFLPTEMYYGTYGDYKNDTVILSYNTPYNLPLAYLAVAGGYILLCVIILVRSMAVSYNKNYISGKDFRDSFFTKIFCSWDYAVTMENSADLQCKNIHIDLMETLNEGREKRKKTSDEQFHMFIVLFITNLIAIGLIGGACYGIHWMKMKGIQLIKDAITETELTKVFISLLPAITITTLNIVLPYVFRIIASMEHYESPKRTIEVSLLRTVVLKLSTLCIYIWLIYRSIETGTFNTNIAKNTTLSNTSVAVTPYCWETSVGVQFYQLAIVDFVFLLLATFIGETVRHSFAVCMNAALGCDFDLPGFDISRNVLSLIYSQALCWLGAFFCPMLPLITIIKFFILFYYKKASVMQFCRPSVRPFKASKMQLRFFALLSMMLTLAMIVIGLIMINEDRLKPSTDCGPFRGRKNIFEMVQVVINRDFGKDLRELTKGVASNVALFGIFFILWAVIYYQRLKKSSAEKKIKLLKDQIALAGEDKKYFLKEIRNALKERVRARQQSPNQVFNPTAM